MIEIHVEKKDGDFGSIQEAVNAVPYEEAAVIYIGKGVFTEKIFSEKADITFIGKGMDDTVIEFGDGANDVMPDGSKRGTFRSYTAFFGGKRAVVKNMTIKNTAGDGTVAGQALAVYADASRCFFENVRLNAHQDTLFCAPLPASERQKNGFLGPRVFAPRAHTKQYYRGCEITGDVDFIFGGADAVFDNCRIICNNRGQAINGYVTAACGLRGDVGFIFRSCVVGGADGCERASVFLGRPWREEARTVFLSCTMDETIAKERFSGWGSTDKDEPQTFYGEFESRLHSGELVDLSCKSPWVKDIDAALADEYNRKANEIIDFCVDK